MAYPIKVEGVTVLFNTDTGSDASLIPPRVYYLLQKRLGRAIPLQTDTDNDFRSISDEIVTLKGYFITKLVFGHTKINERIYVVENERSPNLLSEEASLTLGLITYAPGGRFIRSTKLNTSEKQKPILPNLCGLKPALERVIELLHIKYPHVYTGTGKLKGFQAKLEIRKDANVRTFYQRAPAAPLHLNTPGKSRVDELVRSGIWEHVPSNIPLQYVSPLLVIPKPNQKADRPLDCRLVGSYVLLNKHLQRTAYVPAQRVEQMQDKLRGCSHFLKCDLNQGYHQIEVCPESRKLLTLSTQWGHYRPTRLPMGIMNSQDIFDGQIQAVLANCLKTLVVRDDILIGAKSQEELVDEYGKVLDCLLYTSPSPRD